MHSKNTIDIMNTYSKYLRYLFGAWLLLVFVGLPVAWIFGKLMSPGDDIIYVVIGGYWVIVYLLLWLVSLVTLLVAYKHWRVESRIEFIEQKRVLKGWLRLHVVLSLIPLAVIIWLQLSSLTDATVPVNCPPGMACETKEIYK